MTSQNYDSPSGRSRAGILVPLSVVDQLDQCLPSLYGLIEAAIQMMEDLPPGIEVTLIRTGLIDRFFQLYHILNGNRIIFLTAFHPEVQGDT